jgi:hypothetical protein
MIQVGLIGYILVFSCGTLSRQRSDTGSNANLYRSFLLASHQFFSISLMS